ncbi:MAG: RsmB/NOP family class I SAM-dependent RNA methyltransferase [Candidatus Bathyarchaeota archaeon]|nr:RsmB/NOP family class I SAM-dependent RNA methyltransferase [Candidatus Bathyarchaeota archaeon]
MSGKEFFVSRYEELGWKFHEFHPKQAIRINTANVRKTDIIRRLRSRGIELAKIPFLEDGYWITKSAFSIGATTEYLLGYYSIQEAAAQIPVTLFSQLENKTVLDACAAPGGKTIQLGNLMHNTGTIIALDNKKSRLIALANQLERCKIKNTIVYHMNAKQASELNMKFDRILLDVPCSGNFAGNSDWFQRRTIKDVRRNARLQRKILSEATKTLTDEGEIIYATCSLEPEENEQNINWAIKNLNLQVEKIHCHGIKANRSIFRKELDILVENCVRIWPEQTQGFFICKLKKRG